MCAIGWPGLRALAEQVHSATVTATPGKDSWTASAKLNGLQLTLTEDTRQRLPTSRTINGQEMPTPVFAVNVEAIAF